MMDKIQNTLIILLYGLSIGVGIYYARYLKTYFRWVKNGIENGDGKLQNKELQLAFFSMLSAFIIITIALWDVTYPDSVIYATFAGAGILYAVNRATEAYKNNKPKN